MIFNELGLCFETSRILRSNLEPKSWSIIVWVACLIFHWQRRERSRRLTMKKEVSSLSWLLMSERFFERPSFDRSHLISLHWSWYQNNIASERWAPSQLILLNSCINDYGLNSGFDLRTLHAVFITKRGLMETNGWNHTYRSRILKPYRLVRTAHCRLDDNWIRPLGSKRWVIMSQQQLQAFISQMQTSSRLLDDLHRAADYSRVEAIVRKSGLTTTVNQAPRKLTNRELEGTAGGHEPFTARCYNSVDICVEAS